MDDFLLCAAGVEFVVICARRESNPRIASLAGLAGLRGTFVSGEIVTYYCVATDWYKSSCPRSQFRAAVRGSRERVKSAWWEYVAGFNVCYHFLLELHPETWGLFCF